MASIEERMDSKGRKSFRVKVRLKGHPTQSATFLRRSDAVRWSQSTEAAIREGRYFKTAEAKRRTLGEAIDRYVRDVLPGKRDRASQSQQLAWWRSNLGAYTLADLTPPLISKARDDLAAEQRPRRRSNSTVNRYLAALSHLCSVATKEWGWMDDNPLRRVAKLKEPRGRVRFLSEDELGRLLHACQEAGHPDLYLAVVLSLSTGARQQEIMTLRWSQIDLNRRVIQLEHTKNGERRALPLSGPVIDLLATRAKVRRIDTDLLFPSRAKPQNPIDLRAPWLAALKAAEIEDFRWHDLRHTAASYLHMSGSSLAEVAELLGHKTLQMVKRYSHFSHEHLTGAVDRMTKKVFGS